MRDLWSNEQLAVERFVPAAEAAAFVEQRQLQWLTDPKAAVPPTPADRQPSAAKVQQRIKELLLAETRSDAIFDYISVSGASIDRESLTSTNVRVLILRLRAQANVSTIDKQFIRGLTTAVVEYSLHENQTSIVERQLKAGNVLLQKYIDNQEQHEVQCLFAIQVLIVKMEHPSGECWCR